MFFAKTDVFYCFLCLLFIIRKNNGEFMYQCLEKFIEDPLPKGRELRSITVQENQELCEYTIFYG